MAPSPTSSLLFTLVFTILIVTAHACSRVAYTSDEADGLRVLVGRSVDWFTQTEPALYAFPAGMAREGCAGENSIKWTSKYGSVIAAMSKCLTVDGMNTEGLTGNLLHLDGTEYGDYNVSRPQLSVALWLQYYLDNFPTVAAIVDDLYDESGLEKLQLAAPPTFQGTTPDAHLSFADSTGDNLIMEYIGGRLKTYHSRGYRVMTNEPPYADQLALDDYWQPMANLTLPGTSRPADRFVRLSHYARLAPQSTNLVEAMAITQSMVRAVSVPMQVPYLGIPDGEQNHSPTLWRVYADLKERKYFFESVNEPVFVWVSLDKIDLSTKGRVMKLDVSNPSRSLEGRRGDATKEFFPSKPFDPLRVRPEERQKGTAPIVQSGSSRHEDQPQHRISNEL